MRDEEDNYFATNILPAYYTCVTKFILNKIIYKLPFICNNITHKISRSTLQKSWQTL
jgi:hypothetical protein